MHRLLKLALPLLVHSLLAQNDAGGEALKGGRYAEAERLYAAAVAADPALAEAHINLGLSRFLQRKYEDAVEALETGLRLDPRLWNGWLFLGISEFNRNRLDRAIAPLEKYVASRSADPQGHYYLGLALLGLERFAGAESRLRQASRLDPANTDILYHLAQSYLGQARNRDQTEPMRLAFENTVREISAIDPASYRLSQLRAGLHHANGDAAKAREELEKLVARDLKIRGIRYTLGCLLIESREYEKAIAQLEAELKLDAPWPRTQLQLGHALVELGRNKEALSALGEARLLEPGNGVVWFEIGRAQTAMSAWPEAVQSFQRAIELGDRRSNVYYRLSAAYRRVGRTQEAQDALAESERLRTREQAETRPELRLTAEQAVEQGVEALNSGRHGEAAGLLGQAWNETARCDVPFYLGLARQRTNDTGGAIIAFRSAAECNPAMLEAHVALAESFAAHGDDNRALAAYEAALKLQPRNTAALRAAAALYLKHQMNDQAVAVLRRLVALEPGNIEVNADLGAALAAVSEAAEAERYFRAALVLDAGFPSALVGLGNLMLKSGKTIEAIALLERALKMTPAGYEVNFLLGTAYARVSRPEEAMTRFQAALAARDADAELHYQLARLLGAMGRTDEQRIALARFSDQKAAEERGKDRQREMKTLLERAREHVEKGDLEAALPPTEAAVRLDSRHAGNLFRLAGLYFDLKQFGKAFPLAEQAIALAPSEWSHHLLAGLIEKARGNQAAARRHFENTLRLNKAAPVPHE